jgi:predicted alpha/beta hydrolase
MSAQSRPADAPQGRLSRRPLLLADGSGNALILRAGAFPPKLEALILAIPAMGVRGDFYANLSTRFRRGGLGLAICDLRGNGDSTVRASRKSDFGYQEMTELDLAAAMDSLAESFPGTPVFLLGHSLGGHVAALYAGCHPYRCAGLILVASGTPYFRNWDLPRGLWILAQIEAASWLARLLGFFPGRLFGFGWREARRLMLQWRRLAWTGKFQGGSWLAAAESALGAVSLPILSLRIQGDDWAPAKAVAHLAAKFAACRTEFMTLPHPGHGSAHFDWIDYPEAAETVEAWALGKLSPVARSGEQSTFPMTEASGA